MKKLLGLLLLSTVVQAATLSSNYDQQFLNANAERNFILNSGAEKSEANVTDSSNIHSRSTSSPIAGVASHLIDGTNSSQNVDFAASNLETGLLGTNCEALFVVNGDASLYTATVRINSADVTSAMTLPNTGSYSQNVSIVFPCGTSGASPVLRITSTSASAAAIKVDSVYLGKAVSLGNVNQVQDVMSWTPTGSWVTNTTYTGRKWRVGDRGFYEVRVLLSGAPTSTALTINMPSGEVIDTAKLTGTESGAVSLGTFDIGKDNGSSYPVGFNIIYNSTTSVAAIVINTAGTYGLQGGVNATVPQTWASGDEMTLRWSAPIVGWTSTSSYSLMNTYWKVDANISGANPSLGTGNVSSYTGIEDASLTLTNNSGTGNITAQIGCSSTNSPSGTTCSSGNESVSVAFTPLGTFPQDVRACIAFSWSGSLGTTAANLLSTTFQIVETATNAQTIIQEGKNRVQGTLLNPTTSTNSYVAGYPFQVCGTFTFTSPGQKMLRLMYEQVVTGTITGSTFLADAGSSQGQRDAHWTVWPLSYNTPAPILVGGVTSFNTSSAMRFDSMRGTKSGTCATDSQSSNWYTISTGGTGVCTHTFATSVFNGTDIPFCTCSSRTIGVGCAVAITSSAATTTTFTTSTGSAVDGSYVLQCMGAR